MNTKPDMTVPEAAGYIAGVALGLVRRFDKFFIILFACIVILLVRIRITYDLPPNFTAWAAGLTEGVLVGIVLWWFLYRKQPR